MSLYSSKEAKISKHSSLAQMKGITGGAVVDLDEFYGNSKVDATKNSEIVSSVIEIASRVSRMRLDLKVEGKKVKKDELSWLLNEKPNRLMKAYDFKYKIIVDTIYNGNAYVEIVRDGNNKIKELKLLNYQYVVVKEVYKSETSTEIEDIVYEYIYDTSDSKNKRRKILYEDMLHFKPFSFGMTVGLSLIDCLERDIRVQEMTKDYLEEYISKKGNVSGVLKLQTDGELASAELKNLVANEWERSGNKGYSVRVTDGFTEYTPSSNASVDFKNVLDSKTNMASFSSLLGMPLHKLGVSTSNMSLEELNNDFKSSTLSKYIEMMTSELNVKLLRNEGDYETTFEFDIHSNNLYDTKTLLSIVNSGGKDGWLTPNEMRELMGRERYDSTVADKLQSSLNYVDAESKNEYQLKGLESEDSEGGVSGDE